MKTRIATMLAVVMFVAAAIVSGSRASAKTPEESPAAPSLSSNGGVTVAAAPLPTNFNFELNHGRITRIYPEPNGVYFRFGGKPGEWQTAMNPTNGYYFIPMSHPNYAALVDLLYLAAERDWNLQARTQPTLGAGGRADVIYLVQDFARP